MFPLIYTELRALAGAQFARERPGHTLQPTALLHEAYIKLVQIREIDWNSRGHFYAMAAKVMRRFLISYARQKNAQKRPKFIDKDLETLPDPWHAPEPLMLALDEALDRLEKESPRAYQLVELKFYAGFSFEEAAQALNVSSRTLKRDWDTAEKWLRREIAEHGK